MNLNKDIKFIEFVYKLGYKPAIEFTGWKRITEILKHKKGRKPQGYRLYTNKGIYMFSIENYALPKR